MKMKMVLKGRARPRWKKEVKMKMFKPRVKLAMFRFYLVAFVCRVVSCHVSSCVHELSVNLSKLL